MNDVTFLKETYLTRAQATEYIRSKGYGIGVHFLTSIATKKQGPPYKYFSNTAIYLISDIDEYLLTIEAEFANPLFRKSERGRPPKIYIKLPKSA